VPFGALKAADYSVQLYSAVPPGESVNPDVPLFARHIPSIGDTHSVCTGNLERGALFSNLVIRFWNPSNTMTRQGQVGQSL
jgi:hypothetical protein